MSDDRRDRARWIAHAAGFAIVVSAAGHSALLLGADFVVLVPTAKLLTAAELASLLLPHTFLCVVTAIALGLSAKRAGHVAWRAGASVAAIAAVLSAVRIDGRTGSAWLLPAAAAAVGLLAGFLDRRRMRMVAPAAMVTMLAWLAAQHPFGRTNRLSLLSSSPNTTQTIDFSGNTNKDNYPVCTFRYNSLGYRDEEPQPSSSRALVLVVGDSYVWGDGIARDDQTLSVQLRRRLEQAAPGRYAVASAAYPGLGMYGYRQIIESLVPELHPAVVVVGFLGEADIDVLDPQLMLDVLAPRPLLGRMVLNLGALQGLHRASRRLDSSGYRIPDRLPPHLARFFGVLEDFCRDEQRRAILIDYFPKDRRLNPASKIEVFELPPALRYQSRSDALWYAKDCHPRASLNEKLGQLVADVIARGKRTTPSDPTAPAERSSPIQSPGKAKNGYAIPAGQDDLIGRLLGAQGAPIGGCDFVSASVRGVFIEARYRCPGSTDGVLLLHHPSQAPSSALARTDRFAVTPGDPAPPSALVQAVVERARQGEHAFRWVEIGKSVSSEPKAAPLSVRVWLLLVAAACGAALVGLRWRSNDAKPSKPDDKS